MDDQSSRAPRCGEVFIAPGRKVVDDDDIVAISQQSVDEMAADKTGAPSDHAKLFHRSPSWVRSIGNAGSLNCDRGESERVIRADKWANCRADSRTTPTAQEPICRSRRYIGRRNILIRAYM